MRSACSLDSSPFVVVILFRYRDSYLTKPSGSAFLIIFRVDAPLSIENWLSLGTHSFLYGLGRFSPMNGSYQILMFDFTEFIQFIGLSLSVFLFCVHSRILSAQFTGLIPFWINFFEFWLYETFGLIPFGLTFLCEVSLRSFLGFKIFFDVIFFPAVSGSSSLVQNRMYLIFSDILSCILKYFPQWWLLRVFVFYDIWFWDELL
jgi:hypothetical protein